MCCGANALLGGGGKRWWVFMQGQNEKKTPLVFKKASNSL